MQNETYEPVPCLSDRVFDTARMSAAAAFQIVLPRMLLDDRHLMLWRSWLEELAYKTVFKMSYISFSYGFDHNSATQGACFTFAMELRAYFPHSYA